MDGKKWKNCCTSVLCKCIHRRCAVNISTGCLKKRVQEFKGLRGARKCPISVGAAINPFDGKSISIIDEDSMSRVISSVYRFFNSRLIKL